MPADAMLEKAKALLPRLRSQLRSESPEPLGAFSLCGERVGVLTPRVMAALRSDAGLSALAAERSPLAFSLRSEPASPEGRSAALDALWLRLEALGLTQPRRGELLDVKDSAGRTLALLERSAFRTLGFMTSAVRAAARFPDGSILLQQRSMSKAVGPGLWDNLAAGMISASEAPDEAMRRELGEEAGADGSLLAPLAFEPSLSFESSCAVPAGWMRERTFTFSLPLPEGFRPVCRDGEAERFAVLRPEEALAMIERGLLMPEAACAVLLQLIKTGR